jgi:hypothetical protein
MLTPLNMEVDRLIYQDTEKKLIVLPLEPSHLPLKSKIKRIDWKCLGLISRLIQNNFLNQNENDFILIPKTLSSRQVFLLIFNKNFLVDKNSITILYSKIKNLNYKSVIFFTSYLNENEITNLKTNKNFNHELEIKWIH